MNESWVIYFAFPEIPDFFVYISTVFCILYNLVLWIMIYSSALLTSLLLLPFKEIQMSIQEQDVSKLGRVFAIVGGGI
jgi:hypothetical protein